MPSKKELERRLQVIGRPVEQMLRQSGCGTLGEWVNKVNHLLDQPKGICLHAICPACDGLFDKREMKRWPGDVEVHGMAGRNQNAKLYCPACHKKIVAAHGKEAEK